MNRDPRFEHFREQAWRGNLLPNQEAQLREWLAAHPEAREDWEAELGLSEALERMPDVSVPSNFTARVLQAVELDKVSKERTAHRHSWSWHRSVVRWAAACVVILAGFVTYQSYVQRIASERMAKSIAAVSRVTPYLNPEILTNFDVICALDRTPPPDEELLRMLQ
jgi:anti-sigma factor RsiW